MKFMFTIYHDEKVLDAMPEQEMQTLVDSAIEYAEELRRSGPLHRLGRSAAERDGPDRPRRGRQARHQRQPLRRNKEQLSGFFLIEAKDMDEACAVAARFPRAPRRGARGPAGSGAHAFARWARSTTLSLPLPAPGGPGLSTIPVHRFPYSVNT